MSDFDETLRAQKTDGIDKCLIKRTDANGENVRFFVVDYIHGENVKFVSYIRAILAYNNIKAAK
jgi:hypothetical protein